MISALHTASSPFSGILIYLSIYLSIYLPSVARCASAGCRLLKNRTVQSYIFKQGPDQPITDQSSNSTQYTARGTKLGRVQGRVVPMSSKHSIYLDWIAPLLAFEVSMAAVPTSLLVLQTSTSLYLV